MAMMILRSTLTPKLLVEVWLSLLWERQVILKSKSLATLTDITAAIEELLYPFKVKIFINCVIFQIFAKRLLIVSLNLA